MTQTDASPAPSSGPEGPRDGQVERRHVFARLAVFYRQVVAELKKVVWPSRQQLLSYTAVVIVFVLVSVTYLVLIDSGFSWLVLKLFGQ